jgi:hypothetical protein
MHHAGGEILLHLSIEKVGSHPVQHAAELMAQLG